MMPAFCEYAQIRISVSSICYMRQLFPEDCYREVDYGSSKIHQLQSADYDEAGVLKIKNTDAFLLTQWLEKGVFAALTSEYLKSLVFSVFTKHPKTNEDLLLENYEFKVSYTDEGSSKHSIKLTKVSLQTKDDVKIQAAKFIRSLIEFTNTLDELPSNRWITFSLTVSFLMEVSQCLQVTCILSIRTKYRQTTSPNTSEQGTTKFTRKYSVPASR
jgi:meiosis-specific protein HOP1